MSLPALKITHLSYEEYLELESASDERHILWDGEMFAMSGGSENHYVLETNLAGLLFIALSGAPCQPSTGNRRLRSLQRTDRAVYADAVVICGGTQPHPADPGAASNPTAVFEVLSDSTEAFDRGKKFAYYRTFPTLSSIVLVSQHEKRIEHFHRPAGSDAWTITELGEGALLELVEIGITLEVNDVYARTEISRSE